MVKSAYAVAGILIALVVGAAVGWAIRPIVSPAPVQPKAKFADIPPPGTKIIHGMDAAYPPFTEIDPTGKAVGFDVDVVDWIAEKYGWEVEHKPWEWAAIVTALLEGDLDFVASGMTHTAARAEKVWFTIPYYSYIHELLVPIGETRTLEEILNSGEYISCQAGATSDEWAEKLLKQGYNFKKLAVDSYELAFEAVMDGRAVAVISDSAFTGPYFKERPDVATKFRVLSTIGGEFVYAYATRPEDYGLRNALNRALEELMGSPKWDELKKKWGI
ncbi:MAG: ABC transporter substrate-binding protein [Candidatus Bathyarchaeia archaeon]